MRDVCQLTRVQISGVLGAPVGGVRASALLLFAVRAVSWVIGIQCGPAALR